MAIRTATFTEGDRELVKKIIGYQKKKKKPSFIAAVRELCEIALTMETAVRKLQ